MIKLISMGNITQITVDDESIYVQVGSSSQGNQLFYGNTAKLIGVDRIEINYNQELFEKEYLCDFTRND